MLDISDKDLARILVKITQDCTRELIPGSIIMQSYDELGELDKRCGGDLGRRTQAWWELYATKLREELDLVEIENAGYRPLPGNSIARMLEDTDESPDNSGSPED